MKKLLLFFAALSFCFFAHSQLLTPLQLMFPTSNGDNLEIDVYLPNATGSFPVILIQTPYGKNNFRNGLPLGIRRNLSASNYAFVILDWRGRFSNLSKFNPSIERGQDGYDLVEWIATQTWSSGKIGTWGPSALGNVQFETAKKQPPHLVCANPQVASPQFYYNKYYAGGAARTAQLKQLDALGFGISAIVGANPYYNLTWSIDESSTLYPDSINVPMLMTGGWYDHNTEAILFQFDTCNKRSTLPAGTKHHLLMGPWVHGGSGAAYVGSANQGQLTYNNAAGVSDSIALEFFDYHLRNINNGWDTKKAVMYYQMGDDQWLEDSQFPVSYTTPTNYYLQNDFSLKTSNSVAGNWPFSYNPTSPSPTVGGATLSTTLDQGPYDQVPSVESRFDLLTFSTPTLTQDLKIKGKIEANFFVSSDKKDTDVAVRITDVYPDGRSMLMLDGIQRMRFRNGYRVSDTSFLDSGVVYPVSIELPSTAITIKAGHQLRVIVTASNYPQYNRNMNNGEEMYPGNNLDSVHNPQFVVNHIHVGGTNASHLVLPVDNTNTSLAERKKSFKVSVFPNPSNGIINIETQEELISISLFSVSGKELINTGVTNKINVSNLASGVYILRFVSQNGVVEKKIVRE
ncbi:MAG: CocE/NonD family hydrolase [Flavobacteriales bacterium]